MVGQAPSYESDGGGVVVGEVTSFMFKLEEACNAIDVDATSENRLELRVVEDG